MALVALLAALSMTEESMALDAPAAKPAVSAPAIVALPAPRTDGGASLAQTLLRRRSVREYAPGPLALPHIGQLLWSAQGITHRGLRTAPSAGALYPLELYVVAGEVSGLEPGIYRYLPARHELALVVAGDARHRLCRAALAQECVAGGAAVFVFTAVERRTTRRYGARGLRYVHIEVGHAAQNLVLQATALDLASVTVGAFDDAAVTRLLGLPEGEVPLYLIPVSRAR